MPHTYTNGIVTFYEDSGEGDVVVLIHGYAGDLRSWRLQVSDLVDAGFRAVRYDVRGHGRSMIAPEGYEFTNFAADLADLLERLNVERPAAEALGVESAHLVGLSMGGGIALQFALSYPQRVRSLALVDSTLPGFTFSGETNTRIEELVVAVRSEGPRSAFERIWLKHPFFDGLRRFPERWEELCEQILAFQAPDMRNGAAPRERVDLTGRLGEISARTLVVVGANDEVDFHLIAELLASNLRDARKVVMEDCWHLPPAEAPSEFNRLLIDFLREGSVKEN